MGTACEQAGSKAGSGRKSRSSLCNRGAGCGHVGRVGPQHQTACPTALCQSRADLPPASPTRLHGVGGRDGHRRRPRPLRHRLPLRVGGLRDGPRRALLQHLQALRRRERSGRVLQAHGPQLRRQRVQARLRRQPALLAAAAVQRSARGCGRRARRCRRTHRPLLYAGSHHRCHSGRARLDAVGSRRGGTRAA